MSDTENGDALREQASIRAAEGHKGLDLLSVLQNVGERLAKVEADNAQMRAEIDGAKKDGTLDLDLAHVKHVMDKHFFHDQPGVPVAEPARPKFDAFTGERLN